MNVTHGGEEHEAAMTRTLKAAKSAGKKAAIFCTSYQIRLLVVIDKTRLNWGTSQHASQTGLRYGVDRYRRRRNHRRVQQAVRRRQWTRLGRRQRRILALYKHA